MKSYSPAICVQDANGSMYFSLNSIPDGTKFPYVNLADTDLTDIPEKFFNCTVERLNVENSDIETIEHLPGLKEVYCKGSNPKYISPYIPDKAIKGLSVKKITRAKVNYMNEYRPNVEVNKYSIDDRHLAASQKTNSR